MSIDLSISYEIMPAQSLSITNRQMGRVLWSTFLETFFVGSSNRKLNEAFATSYLACQPIRDLTPYTGIVAVPPAHYIKFLGDQIVRKPHWEWMAKGRIRYKTDAEYEEHFLALFRGAVERRTGPGAPVMAQLSGGMDSTSIVCMSDYARRSRDPNAELVDTISFYDESEPNWNERPYFSIVEAKRGKAGIHIETSFMDRTFEPPDLSEGVHLFPGADRSTIAREKKLQECVDRGGYRVILSGIGGDEVLGGVPTPSPELADHLMSGNFSLLLRKILDWALVDRSPAIYMLLDTIKFMAGLYGQVHIDKSRLSPWIRPHLRRAYIKLAKSGVVGRDRLGISPSAICNGLTWWSIMETLPHLQPSTLTRYEYRYPYLDRDLVDFLFRVPREQLVRPGRRRSLMRRALKEIVPVEILERRRKAFGIRGLLVSLQRSESLIEELFAKSLMNQHGLVDLKQLLVALKLTTGGTDPKWWPGIFNAINYELWLRANSNADIAPALGQKVQMFKLPTSRPDKFHTGEVANH
jgi:asparagine synthase (glutamine-hydrolysing)